MNLSMYSSMTSESFLAAAHAATSLSMSSMSHSGFQDLNPELFGKVLPPRIPGRN